MYNLNRRDFCIALGAAGAGFCLPGAAGALTETQETTARGKKLFEFAVIADTHIQTRAQEARNMSLIMEEINNSDAEFTACLGDLVNQGESNPTRYPEWKGIAGQLKKPWYAVPGNHDPVNLFQKHIQEKTDFIVDHKNIRFIYYNNARTDSHNGFITPEQLEWIDQSVEQGVNYKRKSILMCHVTAHKNSHPDRGWWMKDPDGGREFAQLLRKRSDSIIAVFNGHHHCGLRGWDDRGAPEVIMTALGGIGNRRPLTGAPGWYLGPQGEQPNGYTQTEVYENAIVLRYKPVGADVIAEKELALG